MRYLSRSTTQIMSLEPRMLLAGGTFNIEVVNEFEDPNSPAAAIVLAAAARWETILLEDIPNVPAGPWGRAVDDIRITAFASEIDGPGGTLATADTRYRRAGSNLPITGLINLDEADINNPGLFDIVVHEMGHLLGIGSLWSTFGLVSGVGSNDPVYTGAAGVAEYRAYRGDPTLTSIPVENTGNPGTSEVHWRESVFARELMTGFYSTGFVNPLSRMSIASLIDFGYPGVNPDAADAYNVASGNPIPTIGSLSVSSATSAPGSSITLTANSVANIGGTITNVRFYRETNGITGMQASGNVLAKDTLVGTATTGAPWQASLDLTGLPAGDYTYYAQVTDSFGAVSIVASVTHSIVAAPTAPVILSLAAGSDSGISDSDRITNVVLPTLLGTSAAGTTVQLFADAIAIGTTTADTNGNWTFTPTTPFANGTRQITATAQNNAGISDPSATFTVTIDTIAPQVTASSFVYLTSLGVTFTFNENVQHSLAGGDLAFQNTTSSTPYAATLADYTANVARFGFANFPPARGDYIATLIGSGVTDVAGNALAGSPSVSFFYLPGDINRSRAVDFDDLLILAQNYGKPGNYANGDMNYSGTVDFDDLLMLAQNYGTSLAVLHPPAQADSKSTTAAKRQSNAAAVLN